MMHAVIRNGHDALHLIGHVDAYNLESLRDHTTAMGRDGGLSVVIEVSPKDEELLTAQAGRWLDRLARSGVPVVVRRNSHPIG
jgi:hypothetical protein